MTEEVVAIRHQVIHLPRKAEDLEAVSLARHRAFRKAAGAIDGCHVRIVPPSGPDGHCFKNRKLQLNFAAGWPLHRHVLGAPPQPTLSAGTLPSSRALYPRRRGYPCLQHPLPLITPKRPLQGVGPQRFNSHHSRARSIIERAFGVLKTRFRSIFLQALEVHHTFVPQVITACAVRHNICIGASDIMAPEEDIGDHDYERKKPINVLPALLGSPLLCLPLLLHVLSDEAVMTLPQPDPRPPPPPLGPPLLNLAVACPLE
ncbi:hypothetical protein F7725_013300 [Dissostichus mawsoni]|uniref:DDE Tnp4 domain-containing protein n=1 Tax=Dissostichus mawsoni TaxID=36200 RepID=A0A7J5YTL2_DISMA|nr:hypothetical protein F7725_013300 [Dissostichus mawsoni]